MNPIERWLVKKEAKKMFKLGKNAHGVVQILLVILQVANVALGLVPAEYKGIAAASIGLLQAVYAYLNHGDSAVKS